jgi:hypothetical protein
MTDEQGDPDDADGKTDHGPTEGQSRAARPIEYGSHHWTTDCCGAGE